MKPALARPLAKDPKNRLANVRVLVADRDPRTARLVQGVLRSFGFQSIEIATDADQVMELLGSKPFGLIITEWHLASSDGIHLVRAIRTAAKDKAVRRDMPIIMLTARADVDAVTRARDAGITEFVAKPFSAATLSHRLMQVIDNPRTFVASDSFVGPCRRRREKPPAEGERRGKRKPGSELPPNRTLAEQIGRDVTAADIFTETLIKTAQRELQNQESVFIDWANDDIIKLETAYKELSKTPTSVKAREAMMNAAYSIKAQAGIFGYDLGTQIGASLVDYLESHPRLNADNLTVLRKHIDTMGVIFHQKIKEAGREIGVELMESLQKLIVKLG